ncbi:lysylphosphatidylglycerol synthase transmembrane domain-containing protein [Streptomyces phyllanthi]
MTTEELTAKPPTGKARPAGRALRALRTHFGTLAGTAIITVLIWRLGTGVFLDGLRRIDGPTLAAALAIGALTTVFSAWRWCVVARGLGIRLPLGPAVADYYRALFLNAALPGGVLGDVHRAVRHGQSTGDMGRGVRAVVLERTAGQAALAVVGVTVLLIAPSPVLQQTRQGTALLGLAALGGLAIWAAVRMGRTTGPSRRGLAVRAMLVEARGALLGRGNWPAVLVSSVVVLAGYVAMFLLAARVAGSPASAGELMPLALLALLAMGLPLNVGGWGPREGVTAWSFGAAGLGASQGLTVAVVYGVLSFAAALPGVLVLVARWCTGRRTAQGRQEEATAPSEPSEKPSEASEKPSEAPLGKPSEAPLGKPSEVTFGKPSEVTTEKYAPKDSTNPARSSFPFAAEPSEGRPMTPESV